MRYLPVNLDVRGKTVVVVGGGDVAWRKCRRLLDACASVTIIAPALKQELRKCAEEGQLLHLPRRYEAGDLAGAFLAYAATDDPVVNRAVAEEAETRGIPANIVDAPELSGFTSPGAIARGDLLITISTGGKSPAMARRIREKLETLFGDEYAEALEILGAVREKLLTEKGISAYNKQILNELVDHDLPVLLMNRSTAEIDHLLLKLCGPGYTLAGLGMGKKDPA